MKWFVKHKFLAVGVISPVLIVMFWVMGVLSPFSDPVPTKTATFPSQIATHHPSELVVYSRSESQLELEAQKRQIELELAQTRELEARLTAEAQLILAGSPERQWELAESWDRLRIKKPELELKLERVKQELQTGQQELERQKVEMERTRRLDDLLAKIKARNIAFNVPSPINLDDTAILQLKLGDAPIEHLSKMIVAPGKKDGAHIEVSEVMVAHLEGSNFAVTPVTPEKQAINKAGITEWMWEVKPKSEGKQHLHLVVSMRFKVDGESVERTVQTFDKEIEIEVTKWQQVSGFFKGNWQWLWTAILLPTFIWLRKKKQTAKTDAKDA